MATDNKSPSYNQEREVVREWLQRHPDGKEAARVLRGECTPSEMSKALDDDSWTDWIELVRDFKDSSVLAASCREAREAFELARQSRSTMGPPGVDKEKWVRFFSPPIGYVLRRQIETVDPDYWNDPVNVYREALAHPEWTPVPADYLRGALERHLPRAVGG